MLLDTLLINLSQALSEFKMHKSSVCWEWISACCFYNVFLLFLGSSAAPNLPLLFHFVPTAATISCPWSAGQVAAAASPGTAVLSAAFFCSVRGAVLSLLCRLEFTALTTAQLCFVLRFLVTNTFYFLAVAPAISVL